MMDFNFKSRFRDKDVTILILQFRTSIKGTSGSDSQCFDEFFSTNTNLQRLAGQCFPPVL